MPNNMPWANFQLILILDINQSASKNDVSVILLFAT